MRWLKDKYPKVIYTKHNSIAPGMFDNLYLDMNGIIHPCCHPTDSNQYGRNEDDMIRKIFVYLEHIFAVIQPTQLLYMAIDGVAPRAKLNQQRSRRYESARERRGVMEDDNSLMSDAADVVEHEMELIRQSLDLGILGTDVAGPVETNSPVIVSASESASSPILVDDDASAFGLDFPEVEADQLPNQEVKGGDLLGWDSNQITPGTPFMLRLADCLRSFIANKQNTDPMWKKVVIIFSDSNSCGEGEHKMINFIRAQRCQPNYNPNTRHLLCGADADLIMLALGLHEPHCSILRERRDTSPTPSPLDTKFDIISINILRQYLGYKRSISFCPPQLLQLLSIVDMAGP